MIMNQEIKFKGLSLNRDEEIIDNGELSLCGGVELHDGALRPSVLSGEYVGRPSGDGITPVPLTTGQDTYKDANGNTIEYPCTLRYVHETTAYKHFIAEYTNGTYHELYWYDFDGTFMGLVHKFSDGVTIKSVESVGNTVIILASDGIHYALWKNTDTLYKYLGQKPPFLTIRFDLSDNQTADYETGGISVDGSADGFNAAFQQTTTKCWDVLNKVETSTAFKAGDTVFRIKTDKQGDITDQVWALINRTNSTIAKAGHFYANFFVRYCYRLYDGSMVMHSAPIFMPVLVPGNFQVYVVNAHKDSDTSVGLDDTIKVNRVDSNGKSYAFSIGKLTFMYNPRNVKLKYTWMSNNEVVSGLKEWSDIVKSIDIFVSAPITRTDSAQTCKNIIMQKPDYGIRTYGEFSNIWHYDGDTSRVGIYVVDVPGLTDEAYADKIANVSAFFKIHSIKINDEFGGTGEWHVITDSSAIENVTTQEQMKDDYKTHNYIFPVGSYVYNHRLNVFGAYEKLFQGFNPQQLFPEYPYLVYKNNANISKMVVRLSTTDGYKHVEIPTSGLGSRSFDTYVLYNMPKFYPDSRADHMYIWWTDIDNNVSHVTDFILTACNELNGAMNIGKFTEDYTYMSSEPTYTVDDIVTMPNKIYTSEADNPYYFPVNGINTVGIGTIRGIASTTRALSQGQFGQYPLMAFSTDGIWALEVASSGTYSSIHPISREVCINAASIAQLDQSVVFATDRALNKVVESSVASFSDMLDGPFFNIASQLGKLRALFAADGKYQDEEIIQLIDFSTPPIEYFKDGTVLNDYVNKRLIILPAVPSQEDIDDNKEVALVYSIRDGAWSTMMIETPLAVLNSNPYPYVQKRDGSVLMLNKKYDYTDQTVHSGLIVTRTLNFQGVRLAINGFAQLSDAKEPGVIFFYGSNDNRTWKCFGWSHQDHVSYLPAPAYRFFRLALFLRLTPGEKYWGTQLNVTQKYAKL